MDRSGMAVLAQERDAARAERDAAQRELAQLRQTLAEQTEHVDAITGRIELMADREAQLRRTFLELHEQLLRRDEELHEQLLRRDEELHEQLLRRDEELRLRNVAEERTAAFQECERYARALEGELEVLQAKLARIRSSLPGRLFHHVRRVLAPGPR